MAAVARDILKDMLLLLAIPVSIVGGIWLAMLLAGRDAQWSDDMGAYVTTNKPCCEPNQLKAVKNPT